MANFKVVHASSNENADDIIFAHAAALAVAGRGELVSLHAHDGKSWVFPDVESTLRHWGTYARLPFEPIEHSCCEDPIETLLDGLRQVKPNLIVTGSHQKRGVRLLLEGSVSRAVVANANVPVLVLPIGGHGIVDPTTGLIGIERVLIPVDSDEASDRALAQVGELLERLEIDNVDIYLLHVGEGDSLESSLCPERSGWRCHRLQREGRLEDVINQVCGEIGIDLVVMPTRGANSVRDVLFGTNTEHTLNKASAPLLVIPPAA